MGLLQNIIKSYKEKHAKEKEYQEDIDIQKKVEAKSKDANERELERYYEEERKKEIVRQLQAFRKKKSSEMWHTNHFTKKLSGRKFGKKSGLGGCMFLK